MLAAFHRHRIATMGAHVFGGANAIGNAAVLAPAHTLGVGRQPAVHQPLRADGLGQPFLVCRVGEGLQLVLIVDGAEEHEGHTRGREGVQIHQHVVTGQNGAQPAGDAVLGVFRRQAGAEVAVQVTVALAAAGGPGHRIGHRHEAQRSPLQLAPAVGEFGQNLPDGHWPGRFIAVHAAQHQHPWSRSQRVEAVQFDDGGGGGMGCRIGHGRKGQGERSGGTKPG